MKYEVIRNRIEKSANKSREAALITVTIAAAVYKTGKDGKEVFAKLVDEAGNDVSEDTFKADIMSAYDLSPNAFKSWKHERLSVARCFAITADGKAEYTGKTFSSYVIVAKGLKTAEAVNEWMKNDEHKSDFASLAALALREKYFTSDGKGKGKAAGNDASEADETEAGNVILDEAAISSLAGELGVIFAHTDETGRKSLALVAEALGLKAEYNNLVKAEYERAKADAKAAAKAEEDAKKKADELANDEAAKKAKAAKAAEATKAAKAADEAAKKAAAKAAEAKTADEARKLDKAAREATKAAAELAKTAAELNK